MKVSLSLLAAASLCILEAAELPPVPELTLPVCSAPPVIDGHLDDPAWKNAALIPQLLQNNTKFPNTHSTRILATCDAENLYVAFRCYEPDMAGLLRKKAAKDYDGRVWQDDCVEVYLGDAENPERFSQYVVNWAGGRFDGIHLPGKVGKPMQFHDLQWKSAVSRGKEEWIVEFAIPFSNANIHPADRTFRINFFREKYHSPGEMLAWSRTYEKIFAIPARFGIMHKAVMPDKVPCSIRVDWPEFIVKPAADAIVSLSAAKKGNGILIGGYQIGDRAPLEFFRKELAFEKGKELRMKVPLGNGLNVEKAAFLIGWRTEGKTYWRSHRTLEIRENFRLEKCPRIVIHGETVFANAFFSEPRKDAFLQCTILKKDGTECKKWRVLPAERLAVTIPTDTLRPGTYRLRMETPSGRAERIFTVISGF